MVSCVGLTSGTGDEGAFITSKMLFGGLSYPDVPATGVATVFLAKAEFDCPARGADVTQAINAPVKRQCNVFRTGIGPPRFNSRVRTERQNFASWVWVACSSGTTLGVLPAAAHVRLRPETSQCREADCRLSPNLPSAATPKLPYRSEHGRLDQIILSVGVEYGQEHFRRPDKYPQRRKRRLRPWKQRASLSEQKANNRRTAYA